jgi:hypothetical protein
MTKKKFSTPSELIQFYMDKIPFEPHKMSKEEVSIWASNITTQLIKNFNKTHLIIENIAANTSSPPNQVSWDIKEK